MCGGAKSTDRSSLPSTPSPPRSVPFALAVSAWWLYQPFSCISLWTAVSAFLAVSALDGCLSFFSCFAQGICGSVHYYGRPACQSGASHPAARGDASTNRRYFHKGVDGCISLFSCISFGRLYQPLGCISLSDGCIGLLAVSACFCRYSQKHSTNTLPTQCRCWMTCIG